MYNTPLKILEYGWLHAIGSDKNLDLGSKTDIIIKQNVIYVHVYMKIN